MVSACVSPNRTSSKLSALMWRAAANKNRGKGGDTSKQTGPHNQLQNIAAITTDSGDNPVVCPYNCGSTNCAAISSTMTNRPNVANVILHPESTAAASNAEQRAAIHTPT